MMTTVPRSRPNLNQALNALIRHAVRTIPEFAHIKPSRILVVAGEARRASRGTVKPLAFAGGKSTDRATGRKKPIVRVQGRRMLYSITLRPLFFRDSTPQERVETILHELFHVSPAFDGTLDRSRRHERMGADFARSLRPIVRRYLKHCPASVLEAFNFHGEVLMLQWLERPTATFLPRINNMRRVYTEEHLFLGPVQMQTRRRARKPKRTAVPTREAAADA
jgi:predicted metallopeptidase